MLYPVIVLLQQPTVARPVPGVQRFQNWMSKTQSFSVKFKVKSSLTNQEGIGTVYVTKPDRFRVSVNWPAYDYTMIKVQGQILEYVRAEKMYQLTQDLPGLIPHGTSFPETMMEALLPPLVTGNFDGFTQKGSPLKVQSTVNGVETDSSSWSGMAAGKLSVRVAADGKLLTFDWTQATPNGIVHRVFELTDYKISPAYPSGIYSMEPPTGFVTYEQPKIVGKLDLGGQVHLGSWQSARGPVLLEDVVRGKLLLVRNRACKPADLLQAFLSKQKLAVETISLATDASSADYWSPTPEVAMALESMGQPLMILVDKQGRVAAMWVGFNPEKQDRLLADIKKAIAGDKDE